MAILKERYYPSDESKKLLTYEETIDLIHKAQNGDIHARDKVFIHNLRLVSSVVESFLKFYPDYNFDELFQEGAMGLLKAITSYDSTKNTKFSTYAVPWIKQKIFQSIYTQDIRKKDHIRNLFKNVEKTKDTLKAKIGREPTDEEITKKVGDLVYTKYKNIIMLYNPQNISFDASTNNVDDDDNYTAHDFVATNCNTEEEIINKTMFSDMKKELVDAITKVLPNNHLQVIILRYGLSGKPPMPFTKIAKELKCSTQNVQRIDKTALKNLRTKIPEDILNNLKEYLQYS